MASLAWRGMGRYGGRLQCAGAGLDTAARSRVPEAHAALRSAHSRAMLAAAARGRSGVSARPPCGASGRAPGFEVSGAPRRRLSGARRRAEAARRAGEPGWDVARVPQPWAYVNATAHCSANLASARQRRGFRWGHIRASCASLQRARPEIATAQCEKNHK